MSDPVMLDLPQECREVFGMFCLAVMDKPEEFVQAFEILLRHSNDAMLKLLAESSAEDLAYTMLCYLPENTRDVVARYMADNPAKRDQALASVRECQQVLNEAIRAEAAKGNAPVLQLLRA